MLYSVIKCAWRNLLLANNIKLVIWQVHSCVNMTEWTVLWYRLDCSSCIVTYSITKYSKSTSILVWYIIKQYWEDLQIIHIEKNLLISPLILFRETNAILWDKHDKEVHKQHNMHILYLNAIFENGTIYN